VEDFEELPRHQALALGVSLVAGLAVAWGHRVGPHIRAEVDRVVGRVVEVGWDHSRVGTVVVPAGMVLARVGRACQADRAFQVGRACQVGTLAAWAERRRREQRRLLERQLEPPHGDV
jgi:hypothetical protein